MKTKLTITIIIILIILIPIAWYLGSPLFIDNEVNEELPFETSHQKTQENIGQKELNTLEELNITDKITVESDEEKEMMGNDPKTLLTGSFIDADSSHKASGDVKVLSFEDKKYLRFENFKVTNGPSLKVYLSTDLDPKDYISLGDLKGNIGNQNYELDKNIDLKKYDKVLIWCEPFAVLFGSAELN